jgi:acyl carrier protein
MTQPAVTGSADHQGRNETDVRALVRTVVIELSPERVDEAGSDARLLEDLAYNSLALVELAFTLEDEFDLSPIEESNARAITTLGAIQEHVVTELRTRGEIITP